MNISLHKDNTIKGQKGSMDLNENIKKDVARIHRRGIPSSYEPDVRCWSLYVEDIWNAEVKDIGSINEKKAN